MNKSVIVVCDHGNASRMVGHFLRMELDRREISADILARGIFAKIPADAEIMASEAVIVAFDEGQLEILKSQGFPDDYAASWRQFCNRVKKLGKPIFCYQDYRTHSRVEPKTLADLAFGK